jgi:apolipoprotein N-acyltransferase
MFTAINAAASRLANARGARLVATALLLGVLATLALPPFHLIPVAVISFTGLLWLLSGERSRRGAFLIGWLFGFGHFTTGLYWVAEAFSVAGFAVWAAPFAVLALAAACALFPGLAALGYRVVCTADAARMGALARVAVFASLWTAAEWLRGNVILGGFPWLLTGYAWTSSIEMIQFASLFGVLGLSWITVFAAGAPAALAWRSNGWRALSVAWVCLVIVAVSGMSRLAGADIPDAPGVSLRLVQANISQFHKWRDDLRNAHLERHLALTMEPASTPFTVVIWPETAVPYVLEKEPGVRARLATVVPPEGVLLTGAVRFNESDDTGPRLWNSLQAVKADGGIVETYDKYRLVPFGEYTPFRWLLGFAKLTQGQTDFSRGPGPRTLDLSDIPSFSPLICYEAIFPGSVLEPSDRPAWMLNITNDGWYGISIGPYQHFEQTRMRAVEEGLPMVRVANTGISGIIDSHGRVRAKLGLGVAGVIDSPLPGALRQPTLYAWLRDWPVAGIMLICLVWSRVQRDKSRHSTVN